jgi:hypothetical protein
MWMGMLDKSPLASLRVFLSAASAILDTSPRSRDRIASRAALKGFISAAFIVAHPPHKTERIPAGHPAVRQAFPW